jgi:hypothetical protein
MQSLAVSQKVCFLLNASMLSAWSLSICIPSILNTNPSTLFFLQSHPTFPSRLLNTFHILSMGFNFDRELVDEKSYERAFRMIFKGPNRKRELDIEAREGARRNEKIEKILLEDGKTFQKKSKC